MELANNNAPIPTPRVRIHGSISSLSGAYCLLALLGGFLAATPDESPLSSSSSSLSSTHLFVLIDQAPAPYHQVPYLLLNHVNTYACLIDQVSARLLDRTRTNNASAQA